MFDDFIVRAFAAGIGLALKLKNNGTKIIKIDFLMKFILITPLNVILLHT